jgi:hypothetical protein
LHAVRVQIARLIHRSRGRGKFSVEAKSVRREFQALFRPWFRRGARSYLSELEVEIFLLLRLVSEPGTTLAKALDTL